MSSHKADQLDLKILTELTADSSISIPRLAEKIDSNTSVIYSRIKRLERNGLIKGYTLIVNEAALGYAVKAMVGINTDTTKRGHIIDGILKIDGVKEVVEVTGRFDIVVMIYSKSLDEMHKVISEKMGRIDGVLSSESFIELKSRTKAMPYMRSNEDST